MSTWSGSKFEPKRGIAFRASSMVRENSEFVRKLKACARFQCQRTSSIDQPSRSTRESETDPTTSSENSPFQGREGSLEL